MTQPLKIIIKIFGKNRGVETDGRETIVDMVIRIIRESDVRRKVKIDSLFFKRMSDDAYLNIGAPTGVLQKEETYECIFKSQIERKTTDMMRSYNVENFDKTWGMESFYVKLTDVNFSVSYFQKFKGVGKLLVHFFPGETLYEALYRDGRFREHTKCVLVIRSCEFLTATDVQISLNGQAVNHTGEVLKFHKRTTVNDTLPLEVNPQPGPSVQMKNHSVDVQMCNSTPLKANRSNYTEYQSNPNPPSSEPAPKVVKDLRTLEGFTFYLKEKFGLETIELQGDENKTNKKGDDGKQTKKNNDKIFKKHYENFALHFNHRVFLSDLEETIRLMKHSIGAIIALNTSKVPVCGATCFRIGTRYVITNHHVVDEIYDLKIKWSDCYVDFNYGEKGQPGYCIGFAPNPVVVYSEELDFAILALNPEGKILPPSVIDPAYGFNIAPAGRQFKGEECLTFIGHPGGFRKQMEVSCPIKHQQEINNHLVLALQVLNEEEYRQHELNVFKACSNPNSVVYDVGTFFKGSSGSPGFLMQEKLLVVLHCRGIPYKGNNNLFAVEEGILMASVVKDVISKINAHDEEKRAILEDIFGQSTVENFYPQQMDIEY